MLKKNAVRDGRNRLIGSVTRGFADDTSIVRDAEGRLLGKTSEKFHNTRGALGNNSVLYLGPSMRSKAAGIVSSRRGDIWK
jgi:hypothetical protein